MNKLVAALLCVVVAVGPLMADSGNSWNKVRYNAGTLNTKVSPSDWNNSLTVTPEVIRLSLNDGQKVEIDPKTVTALSYGQEAHRRVGTMVALAILVAPVALFGLFHKTKLHYIGIEYEKDGKKGGLLLQGHKDNYRGILLALKSVTGKEVAKASEDTGNSSAAIGSTNVHRTSEVATSPSAVQSPVATAAALKLLGMTGETNSVYGFRVLAVAADSPAQRAGLMVNDYVVAVNGKAVKNGDDIAAAVTSGPDRAIVTINKPEWLPNQTKDYAVTLK